MKGPFTLNSKNQTALLPLETAAGYDYLNAAGCRYRAFNTGPPYLAYGKKIHFQAINVKLGSHMEMAILKRMVAISRL